VLDDLLAAIAADTPQAHAWRCTCGHSVPMNELLPDKLLADVTYAV
jgi:hypothetical protein